MRYPVRLLIGVCSTAVAAIQISPAIAQTAPSTAVKSEVPGDEARGEGSQDIVVTASRISRSGFTAPSPTTVIGEDLIESRAVTNVIDIINEVPAFRPSQTPAAAARGGFSSGGSFVDLRGLSAVGGPATARTLVLVDGRRFVPSNEIGQVDLSLVPTSLVARTEVVTGGASAAWGSDAIAGVVNLILKSDLEGLEGGVGYGQSDRSDYKEYSFNLAGGTSFAGERGHIIAGADYFNNKGIPDNFISRDWGRRAYGQLSLTAGRPAGVSSRMILPDVRFSDRLAPGGVIVGGPLDNTEFLPGGLTRTFTPGTLVGGNQMAGGGANNSNAGVYFTGGSNLVNPMERYALMARITYDITDDIELFVEGSRGRTLFNGFQASHRDDQNIIVQRDNAFLPESVRQQMIANNLQTITVGRVAVDDNYNYYRLKTRQTVNRIVAGASGSLFEDWKWDVYYQYGRSRYLQNNQGTEMPNYRAAIDAVRDVNGNIVCRPGAADNPDPGCVPFNIFGQNSPSQAAVDYVFKMMINRVTTQQQAAAVNIAGEPFSLWAGPVSFAIGAEYRQEKVESRVDADSQARRYDVTNFQRIVGKYDTKEIYAETVIPLLKDLPFAKSFEINAAVRRTDYSTSGAVTTWKIGASYEPFADLRVRATRSRDIRAPNLNELYAGRTSGRALVNDPFTANPAMQINQSVSGNPNLKPEKADTFTIGAIYQPSWIGGLRVSADYYQIKINDVISQFTGQNILDQCFTGNTALCALISRNSSNVITEIRGQPLNFNSLETQGVDFELSYALPRDTVVPGQFTLRALGTYVDKLVLTNIVGAIDRVRETVPAWSFNVTLGYTVGRFSGSAQVRYVGSTLFDATLVGPDNPAFNPAAANSINVNRRPLVAYLNLSVQYNLLEQGKRSLQLFGVANNVFDRAPPPYGNLNTVNGSLYDLIGRSYRAGVRFKY